MNKNKAKAIVKNLAVAFFFTSFFIFLVLIIFQKKIDKTITLINKVAVVSASNDKKKANIKMNKLEKRLIEYPSYGDVFGTIKIPSQSIEVSIYHGDALRLLKYGVGHHAGTYFPGEGGTILIAGHNTYAQFRNLPNIKGNDEIIIDAIYGTYTYKVEKTEIIDAKQLNESLSINDEKEELILYTCYPVDTPGFKTKRFVVYASLVGDNNEK
ncbi:MAG: class D sortase [Bacilli bacterium]|nr:class D sortase [Bacilli bacterium]